jgi:hypothetical protein
MALPLQEWSGMFQPSCKYVPPLDALRAPFSFDSNVAHEEDASTGAF